MALIWGRLKGASRTAVDTSMDFEVLPETRCQGLFNTVHRIFKISTRQKPEALQLPAFFSMLPIYQLLYGIGSQLFLYSLYSKDKNHNSISSEKNKCFWLSSIVNILFSQTVLQLVIISLNKSSLMPLLNNSSLKHATLMHTGIMLEDRAIRSPISLSNLPTDLIK